MSLWAKSRGLEVVLGDLATARKKLSGEFFDCLLISNILHLAEDPARLLSSFTMFLSNSSTVIAAVPNLPSIKVAWKRMHDAERCKFLGDSSRTKVHVASRSVAQRWFTDAGMDVERFVDLIPERLKVIDRLTLKSIRPLLAFEMVLIGKRKRESRSDLEALCHNSDECSHTLVRK
jgi:hypothetical protein